MGSVTGNAPAPIRELRIPANLGNLEREIDRIEESYSTLHDRLASVRRNEGTVGQSDKKPEEQPEQCEVAEILRMYTNRLRNLRERIQYQLEVLET